MDRLLHTPLAAAPAFLDRPAVLSGARSWTWREVHAAAIALAGRLAPGTTVCNLCDSRAGFLITWIAALRRGCLQVLPPSSGHAELAAILSSARQPVIVVDADASAAAWAGQFECLQVTFEPPGASLDDARSKLSYDLYYVKNFNILFDLRIVLQTLRVVMWAGADAR